MSAALRHPIAPSNSTPGAERTLWLAVGASLLLHALLLSLHFSFPEASRTFQDKALDIILVNSRSAHRPSDAQALAQARIDDLPGDVGDGDLRCRRAAGLVLQRHGDAVALERIERQAQVQQAGELHALGAQRQHETIRRNPFATGLHRTQRVAFTTHLTDAGTTDEAEVRMGLHGRHQRAAELRTIARLFARRVNAADPVALRVAQRRLDADAFGRAQDFLLAAILRLELHLLRGGFQSLRVGEHHQLAGTLMVE